MGKIIKYEWKKQHASRFIILFGLLVCLASFIIGCLLNKDTLAVISVLVMIFGSFLVIFYTGIESLLIFNRDLRTKQSHMLWMLPKSTYEILGAKFISAILQMLFVFAAFTIAGLISVIILTATFGEIEMLLDLIQQVFKNLFNLNINWGMVISTLALIFLSWALTIMAGFLAIILSRTLFLNSRFSGLFSILLFLIINYVVERVYSTLGGVFVGTNHALIPNIAYTLVFYAIACLGLFGISGVLADKKLSV